MIGLSFTSTDDFRRELVRDMRDMQTFLRNMIGPLCARHDITLQQFYVMMELNVEPGQTVTQISDRVGIQRTNFTSTCRKMEEEGLVERKQSASDHRSYLLYLTGEGHDTLAAINADAEHAFGQQFANEPEETFETIFAGMAALHAFVNKLEHTGALAPKR